MRYDEVNWPRLRERYARWWRGELDEPILHIRTWSSAPTEPRPSAHHAVKRWFMDPQARMTRELTNARHSLYFADAFPTLDIGRINIGQAAFYGCKTNFTQHTIWVEPNLETWDGWEEKLRFDPDNELWQLTVQQARRAMELAEGKLAITMLGGFEGPLDNLSTCRGPAQALLDVIECPERVLALERHFLNDFRRYFFTLYDLIKDNPCGVALWSLILMTDGPCHCLQSDFSCMISPEYFRRLGRWYLEEQAALFAHTNYHVDGSNAIQHLPMLYEMKQLDCIQYIYQVPEGKRLVDIIPVLREILAAGKRAEVYAWDLAEVIPVLEQVPHQGLKLNIFPPSEKEALALLANIRSLGLAVE